MDVVPTVQIWTSVSSVPSLARPSAKYSNLIETEASLPRWVRLAAGALSVLSGCTPFVAVGVMPSRNPDQRVVTLFPVAAIIMHVVYAAGFLR